MRFQLYAGDFTSGNIDAETPLMDTGELHLKAWDSNNFATGMGRRGFHFKYTLPEAEYITLRVQLDDLPPVIKALPPQGP